MIWNNVFMKFNSSPNGEWSSTILFSSRSLITLCLNNYENTPVSSISFPDQYNDAIDLNSEYPIIWYPIYQQSTFKIIGVLEIASPRLLTFNHAAMLEIEDSQIIDTFLNFYAGQLEILKRTAKE